MKRICLLFVVSLLTIGICACGSGEKTYTQSEVDQMLEEAKQSQDATDTKAETAEPTKAATPKPTKAPTTKPKSDVVFTNKFGTPTTICAHSGCNNYIAPSGDTNCCTIHSKRCLECHKYIDEDALYCIDCLVVALDQQ